MCHRHLNIYVYLRRNCFLKLVESAYMDHGTTPQFAPFIKATMFSNLLYGLWKNFLGLSGLVNLLFSPC